MWRELDLFGVFLPPLLAYLGAALVLHVLLRIALDWVRFWRWVWNPPLAEAGLYVCVLGLLVEFL